MKSGLCCWWYADRGLVGESLASRVCDLLDDHSDVVESEFGPEGDRPGPTEPGPAAVPVLDILPLRMDSLSKAAE